MRTEDGDLIRRCKNGDSSAFGFLVDKYKEAVYASAYAKVRNFADAEDLTQEVFIKAYQHLGNLRHYDRFRAWLYAICANLAKNFLRSKANRPDREFVEEVEQEVIDYPAMEAYHREKRYEPLHEALEELPEIYRQALTLHYLGGMKRQEIAQFLGTSQETIKSRLYRARLMLKKEIITMMSTTFDEMRLQPGFTFRIAEAIKQTKIQVPPSKMTLPFGVSAMAGLIVLLLSLSLPYSPLYPIGQLIGSVLPSQTQVLDDGIIPVDIIESTKILSLSPNMADGNFGKKPMPGSPKFLGGGKWERKADSITARWAATTSTLNEKIYVIGGTIGGIPAGFAGAAKVEIYDPAADAWANGAAMLTPTMGYASAAVNAKIYIFGGVFHTQVVQEYDPVADKWIKKANMRTPRTGAAAIVIENQVYVIGGSRDPVGVFRTLEVYNPIQDRWIKKADMPTPRTGPSACVVNGKIYVLGGKPAMFGDNALATVEEYDPKMNMWTKKTDMLTPRVSFGLGVVNEKIYVFGGLNQKNGWLIKPIDMYDPQTDKWAEVGEMQTPRAFLTSAVLNGKVYILGGAQRNNQPLKLVESYDINAKEPQSVSPAGKLSTTWGEIKTAN